MKRGHASTWHCIRLKKPRLNGHDASNGDACRHPSSSSTRPDGDGGISPSMANVCKEVRDIWNERVASNKLELNIADKLEEGFPELDEWTQPDIVARMLRAMEGMKKKRQTCL